MMDGTRRREQVHKARISFAPSYALCSSRRAGTVATRGAEGRMSSSYRIAIVGGGLAGLAAAHALKAFGMKPEVFEAAPALGEIGAAVNVSPQAFKALQAIGLGDKVAAVATASPGIYTRNMQTGEFLEFNDRHKAGGAVRRSLLQLSPRRSARRARQRTRSSRHLPGAPPDGTTGAKRPHHPHLR